MYKIVDQPKKTSENVQEKYIVISPGRAASNSLFNYIHRSLNNLNVSHEIENLETPLIWMDTVEDPEEWTVVISTRQDMLAQTISFYLILLTGQSHVTGKNGNIYNSKSIENFILPRTYFFAFAYGILFFHERVFKYKHWDKFKKVHWLNYEEITQDWEGTGKLLGFNDWNSSLLHATGYGSVWDKVINKTEVLSWVEELQLTNIFTLDKEKYK
jgi:hypothetical protein